MCLVNGFAVLFALAACWNLLSGDFENAGFGFVIAGVLAVVGWLLGREEHEAEAFEAWLLSNREPLLNGEAMSYKGQPLALQTEVTRYFIVFSALVVSTRMPSRYLVRGTVKTRATGIFCSLLSFCFGWWALPEGPLSTLWALGKNARGGDRISVAQKLNELVKAQTSNALGEGQRG